MEAQDRLATYEDNESEDGPLAGRQWFTYAIGSVAMSSSKMDVAAGNLYAALLQTDLESVVAYGHSFDVTRQSCLAAINALPDDDIYELVRDALGRAKDLYEDRNAVVHGVWHGEEAPVNNTRRAVRHRRHGKMIELEWTQRGLMFLAGALIDMTNEFNALSEAVDLTRAAELGRR